MAVPVIELTPLELVRQVEVVQTVPEVGRVSEVSAEVVKVRALEPKVMVLESAPARVSEWLTVKVLPSRMVRVEPVAGAVRVSLLIAPEVIVPVPDKPTVKLPEVLVVVAVNRIVPSVSLSIVSPFCNNKSVVMEVEAILMALVIPPAIAPELEIRSASVMTVEPAVEVSALSRTNRAATALSVVLATT